jgi:DNA-directed RNA polymerase specialized sigma24 family protein
MAHRRSDRPRSLTGLGFAHLLARLDADADRAAAEYERLRLTLVKFFDWRGAWPPDECADETIDRLVAKLELETSIDDVRRYAYGIARLVLLERLRRQAQTPIDEHPDLSNLRAPSLATATAPLHECFERCLAALPDETRALVLGYYVAEGHAKIENRRRLARSMGISDNALRSRVQRIRDGLERCAHACADAAETQGLDTALQHVTVVPDTIEMKPPDGH